MVPRKYTLEDRKALLLAQGELERLKIAISCRALRGMVRPDHDDYRAEKKGAIGLALRALIVVLGTTRARRLQRNASWALIGWRLLHYWNKGR